MRFTEEEIGRLITEKIYGLTHKKISSTSEVLVESGILSSITIAELAVELEQTFSVAVSFMEINKENFNTVNDIKALIKKKLV